MTGSDRVEAFVAAAGRRITLIEAMHGAGTGIAIGAIAVLIAAAKRAPITLPVMIGIVIGAAVAGAIVGALRSRRVDVPAAIEQRAPDSQNMVLTATEVAAAPDRTPAYVAELVSDGAAGVVARLQLRTMFPAAPALRFVLAALSLWIPASIASISMSQEGEPFGIETSVADAKAIVIVVSPPQYTGRPQQTLTNPARIEAIAGSRIVITAPGDSVTVETAEGALRPSEESPGTYTMTAMSDGFIAIRRGSGERQLIGLTVIPDQSPRVKITAPGRDMFLAVTGGRIPVAIEAGDDIALSSLRLRYTRVSGSGERFEFIEGELPVRVERADARSWKAAGSIDLAALSLEQGDMLVYRGAATDGRPGATATESDAFIVEITSPGSAAAEGFAIDDEQDKYALSQQMVILKTERLIARSPALAPDSLNYYAQSIAAEQRSVRAEFVFMMGGEVAEEVIAAAGITDLDETHEAENESELAAGRLVNRGRTALVEAIRLMSRANTNLARGELQNALKEEKAALIALQDAFSRTRYILRALTQRERLDMARRLTGPLELAARDSRPAANPAADPQVASLRRVLAGIATLAGGAPDVRTDAATALALAQDVLAVDPADTTLQRVGTRLQDAARQLSSDDRRPAERHLDEAATALAEALRNRLAMEAADRDDDGLRRLRGDIERARRQGAGR